MTAGVWPERHPENSVDLTPYEDRLREAFPEAEKVIVMPFDFGARYGAAVQYSGTRRYAARVADLAEFDAAIAELRDWFAGLPA